MANAQTQINASFGIVSVQLIVPPISTAAPIPNNNPSDQQVDTTLQIVTNGYKRR